MAIRGKDFIISIVQDGVSKPICHATDCIINMDFEAREISGPQGQWRDYIGGYSGYNLSVPGVVMYTEVMNYIQLEQIAKLRQKVQWHAGEYDNEGVVHSGTMLITSLNLTSQFRDAVKFEMTAIGCGEKETGLLPFVREVYLADEFKVRLPGCPNPYPVSVYWYNSDGSAPGEFLGIAFNNDDVVSLYNNYAENEYYELSVGTSGCDFNLLVDWNAPFIPDVVFAQAAPELGMSPDFDLDYGMSPDQDNDELLSPGYA